MAEEQGHPTCNNYRNSLLPRTTTGTSSPFTMPPLVKIGLLESFIITIRSLNNSPHQVRLESSASEEEEDTHRRATCS